MRRYRIDTWSNDTLKYLFTESRLRPYATWPQWSLSWLESLVKRANYYLGNLQSERRYDSFWGGLTHQERLESLLQLLVHPISLAEQKRVIAIERGKHPTRIEFPSARHTVKRWQLSQVHCYLTTVGKVNSESYQRVLQVLKPTLSQVNDFYRYQIWLMANAKTPGRLAGLAELIGATPLTAEQVWHYLKQHYL